MNFKYEIGKIKELVKAPEEEMDVSNWSDEDMIECCEMGRNLPVDEKGNERLSEKQLNRISELCQKYGTVIK